MWLPVEKQDGQGATRLFTPEEPRLPDGVQQEPDFLPEHYFDSGVFVDNNNGTLSNSRVRLSLMLEALWFKLSRMVRAEIAAGTLMAIFAVLFGTGIIVYFLLDHEPLIFVPAISATVAFAFARTMTVHTNRYYALMAIVAVFAGMAVAQFRTMNALSPALTGSMTAQVAGRIVSLEQRANGSVRFLLAPEKIETVKPQDLPRYVRLSARKLPAGAAPGKELHGLAGIGAYSGPAYPGGYDFSFLPRFEGIGGTGFFMGSPTVVSASKPLSWQQELAGDIEQFRTAIARRIRANLDGKQGDVAVALITGERAGLDDEVQESLRKSGLAHILAISGLHMGLVTLTLIWFLRGVFALFPGFVQSHPVRKYAALAGLTSASFYLVLSGNSVASQRAWIMIVVMLLAMLFDRRALTLRSIAIAALVILILSPEQIFSAGFQMSFAAVVSLVAVYGAWTRYRQTRNREVEPVSNGPMSFFRKLLFYIMGLAVTSIVAGLATGIFSAWHFQRVAVLGLAANLAAMPVVSIMVMPFALLSMVLMPYGLEALPLHVMGLGIDWVLAVSDKVNSYGSDRTTGVLPVAFLVLASMGLVILAVLKTSLRLVGLAPLGLALVYIKPVTMPDIVVEENGRSIAVRSVDHRDGEDHLYENLLFPYPNKQKFIRDIWIKAWPERLIDQNSGLQPVQFHDCDKDGCIMELSGRGLAYLVYDPDYLDDACERADILIAPRLKWVHCKGKHRPQIILKREDFENNGSHALYFMAENSASTTIDATSKGTENSDAEKTDAAVDLASNSARQPHPQWRIETAINRHNRPWSRAPITYQDQ